MGRIYEHSYNESQLSVTILNLVRGRMRGAISGVQTGRFNAVVPQHGHGTSPPRRLLLALPELLGAEHWVLSSSPAPAALTNCGTASLLCCCSSQPREGGKLLSLPCPAACSPQQHEGHEAAPSSGSKASTGVHTPHTDHPRCPSPVLAAPPAPARGWCFSQGHQGTRGQGKSSTASTAPVCPASSCRSCPRPPLPSSRAAFSWQGRKSGKPCLRAHMEGLGRCPSFSSKKKCTSHGINILVCLLLSSPQAAAQKPQQQPSAQPSWHSLPSDPHSHQRLPQQKPVQSHLGA